MEQSSVRVVISDYDIDSCKNGKDHNRGMMALSCVVCIWVVSAELMQFMLEGKGGYDEPVFITFISACSFALYAIGILKDKDMYSDFVNKDLKRFGVVAGIFCVMWICANLAFNASLETTSAASATALASCSSIFALVGGLCLGVETFHWKKVCAVLCCFIGIVLTTSNDTKNKDDSKDRSLFGDGLAIGSAALYAAYLLLFQKCVGEKISLSNFLTIVGLWAILLTPLLPLLETFQTPTMSQALMLFVNAVIGTAVSERLWLYGALHCGPTTATIALVLTIPLTAIVDFSRGRLVMHGINWVLGAVMIVGSFVLAGVS
eukprot:m.37219 g.37219  ORF g.37219 m.37219 type:complete len:319 (+) comp17602_c0_seq2:469-1425(+)